MCVDVLIWCMFIAADLVVGGVGLPSWVPWCYFFYTAWLANVTRALWRRL